MRDHATTPGRRRACGCRGSASACCRPSIPGCVIRPIDRLWTPLRLGILFFFFFWKGPHPSFLFPSVFLSFESAQNRRETAGSEPLPVATADDSWRAKWRRRARDLSCCHPSAGAFQRRDHRPALLVRVDSLAGQVTCSQERPRPDGGSGRPAARRLTA